MGGNAHRGAAGIDGNAGDREKKVCTGGGGGR